MAEEKGKVVLIGKTRSERTTLANMLVSGELKERAQQPTDTNSICKTYVGRGWTVIDTMGFGCEPLGGLVPDEYARTMVTDFLEEVKGRYSHIIFVVDGSNIGPDDKLITMPYMWKTFLEIFTGSEENFVVLVTNVRSATSVEEMDAYSSAESEEMDAMSSTESEEINGLSSAESEEMDAMSSTESEEMDAMSSTESEEMDAMSSTESEVMDAMSSPESEEMDALSSAETEEMDALSSAEREAMDALSLAEIGEIVAMSLAKDEEMDPMSLAEIAEALGFTQFEEAMSINKFKVYIRLMFPECKQFLFADFRKFPKAPEATQDEGIAEMRQGELERLEKEMKEIFKDSPWVEPDICKMVAEEIKNMATKIALHLTSSRASELRNWESWHGSAYNEPWDVDAQSGTLEMARSASRIKGMRTDVVMDKVLGKVLDKVLDEMQNFGTKVKFYRRQCEYLLQRSLAASKETHDLLAGMNGDERRLKPSEFRLTKRLEKLICSMKAGRELLRLCGDSDKEHEVALTLSPPGSGTNSFSKFALVLREMDWSLDAFRFLLFHNPEVVERASTQSKQPSRLFKKIRSHNPEFEPTSIQSWISKFMWCEARCRLVFMGADGQNNFADADLTEFCLAADNDRHAQDQQDLISSMESHFSTLQNPSKVQNKLDCGLGGLFSKQKLFNRQLSSSVISSYMSILKNRLQGPGDSFSQTGSITIPTGFWIPGNQEFRSIRRIGEGSYKEVDECEWFGMNVAVATSQCDQDGPSRTAFEAEAAVLARVQHPNVVSLIGCSYNEETHQGFLVTELMETSLRALIDRGIRRRKSAYPFAVSEAIDILLQIVEAMVHVHACGVMHRDLKADNLLVNRASDEKGGLFVAVVKLIDFGTSKPRSAEMGSYFKTTDKGTPGWMAPEVIRQGGDEMKLYTLSADVYSFGMTCFEILTGELPFLSCRGRALSEMICAGHRPPIPDNCPGLLRELMTKCWAHVPEDRPTFEEIRQDLWNLKFYSTICGI